MSILKNFVNPWESTETLGSQALGTEVLEGNVIQPKGEEKTAEIEIAIERTDLGKGNLLLLFGSKVGKYDERFSKKSLEKNNELWDYLVTYQKLYDVLDRVKKYLTKHPNTSFDNVVIHSHGKNNAIVIKNTGFSLSYLYGKDIKDYMSNNLDKDMITYKMMELLELIGDNMADGGNIVFLACSAGIELTGRETEVQKKVIEEELKTNGEVSEALGRFYSVQGKTINLFFNKNNTRFGHISGTNIFGMPWGRGLSYSNTGWRIIQSNPDVNKMNVTEIDKDIAIFRESDLEPSDDGLIKVNHGLIKPI